MLQHKKELQEIELEIRYPEMTKKVSQMIQLIRQYDFVIEGFKGDKVYQISLDQIYYIESTDRKTFIYLDQDVYESRKTIQVIETMIDGSTMVRIGKSILLNIAMLKSVKPYPNHRIMVELSNGEHLIVSRRYIGSLKERIRREYGT
ncbi:LytTR family DNA-binding domain-containing protein [Anaerocolumna sp. MB42-C2]|uniref:LytTR family DNA-binding domain-containing protein n=1 Tax=Anaerocolumna sp. MB42-C2 TaxID=3070997 RepID=UPI0027E0DF4C|nr:LytTR family DNA-binding domain-containing protein [Anaerocolumna sp. MB42-C2]WMJ90732.1 LytTR family DNA-binding domain-containing protein [Anaerocolumna sp. MB42-C2]